MPPFLFICGYTTPGSSENQQIAKDFTLQFLLISYPFEFYKVVILQQDAHK